MIEKVFLFSRKGLDMKGGISMPDATKAMGRPIRVRIYQQQKHMMLTKPIHYWIIGNL